MPNNSPKEEKKCVCGSERAILKDNRCINCNISSLSWQEKEREKWEKSELYNQKIDGDIYYYSQEICDYWLARIKSAREESRAETLNEVIEMLSKIMPVYHKNKPNATFGEWEETRDKNSKIESQHFIILLAISSLQKLTKKEI